MSNTTDSGSDFTYEMPESIASVLASQGFSEAARVFQSIGGDAVPQAMRAQLSMALPERTVTPDDVQQEIDEMILRVGSANDPAVHQARAVLQGLVGKPMAQLKAAAAYLETLTSYGQNRQSADDETPEARLERAWAAFDKADKKLDEAFGELPLTEEQRREYERLKEEERKAREQYDKAATMEEKALALQKLEAATAKTSSFVDATVENGVHTGQFTEAQGQSVLHANEERDNTLDEVTDKFFAAQQAQSNTAGFSKQQPANDGAADTLSSAAYNPEANAPTLLDIPPAVASSPAPAANTNQPAVASAVTASAEQPYEIADVSLGETGQFTPASTSQPGAAATGRGI